MTSLSDIAIGVAGVVAGLALLAGLWAALGLFLGVAWNAFRWVTGA